MRGAKQPTLKKGQNNNNSPLAHKKKQIRAKS
jgi:hypothetical protein